MSGVVDLQAMKQRLEKMKEQMRLEKEANKNPEPSSVTPEVREPSVAPLDDNSVFVGGLDFSVRKEDLIEFFENCGEIKRCTIQEVHYTHKPKGYAYIEFSDVEGVENALKFDGKVLKSRIIQVRRKRANVPKPHPRRRFRRH
jgi:polyadenylate-binding protein 2